VGDGKVKITLSYSDWFDGPVAPASFEVPLRGMTEAKKASSK
jgi:hypothetical protein